MQHEDVARQVVSLLGDRTIATAESCTAGRVAEVLACVEKASEFLRGGLVAYQEAIKRELLGVTPRRCSPLSPQSRWQRASPGC